jgi:hypothetical protein
MSETQPQPLISYSVPMSETQPQYQTGDQVTISRGKLRGELGRVIEVDTEREQYALNTSNGLTVVSFSAVKPRVEPTITKSQLSNVLSQWSAEDDGGDAEAFIMNRLANEIPGWD